MKQETIIGFAVGLLIGISATFGLSQLTRQEDAATQSMMQPMTSTSAHNDQATAQLKDLRGDAFDKAFIEEMIMHHQGAIDMAELIETNAKHDELKQLGHEIISAQSKEIVMMQGWLEDWGYEDASETHHMPQQMH